MISLFTYILIVYLENVYFRKTVAFHSIRRIFVLKTILESVSCVKNVIVALTSALCCLWSRKSSTAKISGFVVENKENRFLFFFTQFLVRLSLQENQSWLFVKMPKTTHVMQMLHAKCDSSSCVILDFNTLKKYMNIVLYET